MDNKELVYRRTRHVVRKTAINGGEKLRDEIKWLLSLPRELAGHFPSVLEYSLRADNTHYYMPFYEFPTLRALLFGGLPLDRAEHVIDEILAFLFNELYPFRSYDSTGDHFTETHIARAKQRLNEATRSHEGFAKLLAVPAIEINGSEFENLPRLIARCEQDPKLCLRLSPPKLVFVHGDLHFDNILVDLSYDGLTSASVLIDPRGFHHGQDVAYDLGKLWHSFHGCYDHIIYGRFDLQEHWDDPSQPRFDFAFTDSNLKRLYCDVGRLIEGKLSHLLEDDHDWKVRTRFTEAMHFASLAPFHLRDEKRATALHLIAVQLLSECLESYQHNSGPSCVS